MVQETDGKQIGSILNNLIRAERFAKAKKQPVVQRGPVLTTLGVPLMEPEDGRFLIDISGGARLCRHSRLCGLPGETDHGKLL